MKLYIASDHAGFALKEALFAFLSELGHTVEDLGAHTLSPDDDYPDLIIPCARRVAEERGTLGIVIGGSGQGEAMAANRVPGARCALFYGPMQAAAAVDASGTGPEDAYDIVRLVRLHNDANVLSIGARFVSEEDAKEAVRLFIETPFSDEERHIRRIAKLA